MTNHDFGTTGRKVHHHHPRISASLPGDPFPWEPEEPARPTIQGATPSPANPADPSSFDLGGGD